MIHECVGLRQASAGQQTIYDVRGKSVGADDYTAQPIGTLWNRSVYSFVPIKSGCRTQMAKNKEWYNRPWYKKLAWRVKLMFS